MNLICFLFEKGIQIKMEHNFFLMERSKFRVLELQVVKRKEILTN